MTAKDREDEPTGPDVRPFLPRPGEPAEAYAARLRALHRDLTVVLEAVERGLAERRRSPPRVAAPAGEADTEDLAEAAIGAPVHASEPAEDEDAEPLPPRAPPETRVPPRPHGPSPLVVAAMLAAVLTVVAVVLAQLL